MVTIKNVPIVKDLDMTAMQKRTAFDLFNEKQYKFCDPNFLPLNYEKTFIMLSPQGEPVEIYEDGSIQNLFSFFKI